MLPNLGNKKLILASRSPRREHLMKGLDIPFEVIPPEKEEEHYAKNMNPFEVPAYLAREKARYFSPRPDRNTILITADTIVLCNHEIIEKPLNREDACRMLNKLSDNHHTVITGVCLMTAQREKVFSAVTEVFFGKITDKEIDYYLTRYKPLDKAGAYGIQEWIGYIGVKRIEGSFFNVMGLPVYQLYEELKSF